DPEAALLDDVAGLLRPGALAGRMERVPPYHPRRAWLADRVAITASRLAAEASMAAFVAGQLTSLRASPLRRWLRPAPAAGPGLPGAPGGGRAAAGRRPVLARPGRPRPARRHGREPGGAGRHRGLCGVAPEGGRGGRPGLVRPVRDGRSADADRAGQRRCRR